MLYKNREIQNLVLQNVKRMKKREIIQKRRISRPRAIDLDKSMASLLLFSASFLQQKVPEGKPERKNS